ncbi:MAG: ArdC family protein [Bacteroidetes bacterium]|nr:ArdC family protein [Bacteroidota bacterium]
MNTKVKTTLNTLVTHFQNGTIPEALSYAMFPVAKTPSANWSLLNRTLMFLSGTADGRGYRQWQHVKRHVKKGAKAFFILVPYFKKVEDEKDDEKMLLTGFRCQPIFRLQDTEGAPLDYQELELPDLPLLDRAEAWGISVCAIPGNYTCYGYYSPTRGEIGLATSDETTFFHELAHAAHERVIGKLKHGQEPLQEIVAELSAQTLCRLVGKSPNDTLGNSYRYIEHYAKKLHLTPHSASLKVLSDTEKVLNLILQPEVQASTQIAT